MAGEHRSDFFYSAAVRAVSGGVSTAHGIPCRSHINALLEKEEQVDYISLSNESPTDNGELSLVSSANESYSKAEQELSRYWFGTQNRRHIETAWKKICHNAQLPYNDSDHLLSLEREMLHSGAIPLANRLQDTQDDLHKHFWRKLNPGQRMAVFCINTQRGHKKASRMVGMGLDGPTFRPAQRTSSFVTNFNRHLLPFLRKELGKDNHSLPVSHQNRMVRSALFLAAHNVNFGQGSSQSLNVDNLFCDCLGRMLEKCADDEGRDPKNVSGNTSDDSRSDRDPSYTLFLDLSGFLGVIDSEYKQLANKLLLMLLIRLFNLFDENPPGSGKTKNEKRAYWLDRLEKNVGVASDKGLGDSLSELKECTLDSSYPRTWTDEGDFNKALDHWFWVRDEDEPDDQEEQSLTARSLPSKQGERDTDKPDVQNDQESLRNHIMYLRRTLPKLIGSLEAGELLRSLPELREREFPGKKQINTLPRVLDQVTKSLVNAGNNMQDINNKLAINTEIQKIKTYRPDVGRIMKSFGDLHEARSRLKKLFTQPYTADRRISRIHQKVLVNLVSQGDESNEQNPGVLTRYRTLGANIICNAGAVNKNNEAKRFIQEVDLLIHQLRLAFNDLSSIHQKSGSLVSPTTCCMDVLGGHRS